MTTYSYDSIYQLTREQRTATDNTWSGLTADGWDDLSVDGWGSMGASDGFDRQYQYDANLNRTVKNINGERTTVLYDAADQIQYLQETSRRTTYSFDANGSEILVLKPDGARTTTIWNYENSPIVTATPDKGTQTSVYDPDNLRVKKIDQDGTTHFVYDGQAYLLETNASNVTVAVYTQEPTEYGYVASQYRFNGSIWEPTYYQQDALGSTMQLTSESETVTDTYSYDAFGVLLDRTGTTETPFQWIGAWGYYKDQTTGLYYVRARDMRSSDGRWRRPDPLLFVDGPNLYVLYFVPNGVDPSGMDRYVGNDSNGIRIYWSGQFCYQTTSVPWKKVPCPGEGGNNSIAVIAGGTLTWIAVDTSIPEPSDVLLPKWVAYGIVGTAAGLVAYAACRRFNYICTFSNCDSGKPCGESGTRRCGWDTVFGGDIPNICGCFPG